MMADSPIVITGLGLVTSLGLSPEETFDAVCAGKSGMGPMPALEQTPSPDKGGGQAIDLPGAGVDGLGRETAYLRFVIERAMSSAGGRRPAAGRVGAIMGTSLHGMRAAGGALRTGDLTRLRGFSADAVLCAATAGLGIEGPRMSTCSACSSSLGAVALAVTLLRSGAADLVIAGGYDAVSEYVYAGFDSLRLVAAGPPRPFGAQREGMKTAEGYAAIVLEREADAAARGARVRGYVAGYGESADAHHLTQPHPQGRGAAEAIRAAMEDAGVDAGQVGLIAAHATSTPNNDASEYAALAAVFGDALARTPVVAFKGNLGHTLGGAGAVELALSIIARERGMVPPTINAEPVDAVFVNLRLNTSAAARGEVDVTLNMSLGFGGANTCVVATSRRPARRARAGDDAVVTGVGVVVPGAIGNEAFMRMRSEGRAASSAKRHPIGEEQIAHLVNARRARRMSEYVKLTLAAATAACEHAGIADVAGFAQGACTILGTSHGSSGFCEAYYAQIVREGLGAANPVLFAEGVPNSGSAQLSLALGIRGGCQTIIGSRLAGIDALSLAAMRIREGRWTRAFVGAGEELCETVCRAYEACGLEGAEGFGAGAVMLVLESRGGAAARGARVLATVGETRWSCGAPGAAAAALLESRDESAGLMWPGATSRPDVHVDRLLRRLQGATPASTGSPGPELFSIGPLAELAALLLGPGPVRPDKTVELLATDLFDGARLLRVSRP